MEYKSFIRKVFSDKYDVLLDLGAGAFSALIIGVGGGSVSYALGGFAFGSAGYAAFLYHLNTRMNSGI